MSLRKLIVASGVLSALVVGAVPAFAGQGGGGAANTSCRKCAATTATPSASATPSPSASASPVASASPTASAAPATSPSATASAAPVTSPSPTASTAPAASPSPTSSTSTSSAPSTQGTWKSPEGTTITVNSAGPWTISRIYQLLKDNAAAPGDFARVAPTLTINVQDTYASSTGTSVGTSSTGAYTGFRATMYLKGVSSTFASQPDAQLAHEYGHAWTLYHLYITRQGDWSPYVSTRWSSTDGSVKLAGDSRLDSTYNWDRKEIMADDYRLLFGTPTAVSQRSAHMNAQIADPRNQPGLATFFLRSWAA